MCHVIVTAWYRGIRQFVILPRPTMSRPTTSLLLVLSICSCTLAFSLPATAFPPAAGTSRAAAGLSFVPRGAANNGVSNRKQARCLSSLVLPLRGGAEGEDESVMPEDGDDAPSAVDDDVESVDESPTSAKSADIIVEEPAPTSGKSPSVALAAALTPVTSVLRSAGTSYSNLLTARPILTKAITASVIFGLSDWSAQQLEGKDDADGTKQKKKDWTRIVTASLVGLLYFGPAAHVWYEKIFQILPGTSLVSTLQKACLGQLMFGPSFTCVFFATSLMQSGTFSIGNWLTKIRQDLPGAWAAGLSFWPLVDLVSYSLIPAKWIPLFVNFCSFVWTIYLSTVANRRREE